MTRKDIAEANAKLALGRKANLGLTTPSDRLVKPDGLPFIPYGACESVLFAALRQPSTTAHNQSSSMLAMQMTQRCPALIGNVRLPAQIWRWLWASMREILLQVVIGSKADLSQVGEIIADGMTGSQRALHF